MRYKTLPVFVVCALATLLFLPNSRADITTGLVGYWSLAAGPGNSNVVDLSGNGNTGTLKNFSDLTYNNMWTTDADPSNGWFYAMLFNQSGEGSDTYINIPDAPSLEMPGSGTIQWTISAWVNCSVAGGSEPANAGIVTKGVISGTAYEYCLYMTGGKFACAFRNNPNSGGEIATSQTIPLANTWYHVVGVCHLPRITVSPSTQGSEVWIYVNGVQEYGTNSNTYTTMETNTTAVTIGCFGAGLNPFEGTIDEVRIYNRELTASDVGQLYANDANYIFNGGIGYWTGLAGSGGSAMLDYASLNFTTNLSTAAVGTPDNLLDLLNVEHADSLSLGCVFADQYNNNRGLVNVASSNITIASGGVAMGNANGPGTLTFLNTAVTYTLASSDNKGLMDGANPTSLAQSGQGTAILTGTNTFSGGTTISSGMIQVGNGGATSSSLSSGAVTDNGSLVFFGNDNPTFNNLISGTGAVTQRGSGTLTLSDTANSYSGGTTVESGGTLVTSSMSDSSSPIGTGAINLNNGSVVYTSSAGDTTARGINGTAGTTNSLSVPAGITLEINGRVTSSAGWLVNYSGPGTLNLGGTGDNSFFGMNVNAGTVILNKTSGTGHAIGNPLTIASGATLQLAGSGYTAEIYSNAAAPVTVNSGGVFDANGSIDFFYSLTISGAGIGGTGALINSSSTPATLDIYELNLSGSPTLGGVGNLTLPGIIAGSGSLTYAGTGELILEGANPNTYSGGTFVTSGILDGNTAGSIPGNVTVNGGELQLDYPTAMSSVATLTLASSLAANSVNLTFGGTQTVAVLIIGSTPMPPGVYGAGAGASNPNGFFEGSGYINVTGYAYWDASGLDASPGSGGTGTWNSANGNWWLSGSSDSAWPTDAIAEFAGSPGTITLASSLNADGLAFLTAGDVVTNFDGTSILTLDGQNPTVTITAGTTQIGCVLGASLPVTFTGPGTVVLSSTNQYANGTIINGATLLANTIADSICSIGPTGTVTIENGGTLSYIGAAPASTARNFTAASPFTSYIDVPNGSLTLSGQVTSGFGSTGQIYTKTSSGTLILGGAGDNSSMTMTINAGEVIINKTSASSAHGLGGGLSTIASGAELQLAGTGNYDLYSGCLLTVSSGGIFDVNSQSDDFSTLTLSGAGVGSGALINSTTTATAVLTNGGSGVVLAGNTTVGGPGNITLSSAVSGAASLTYAGTGTLALTNANSFSGGIIINSGGTVLLTNSASAGGSGAITDNGTLAVGILGNNVILNNTISGAGVINLTETPNDNLQLGGVMSGFTGTLNCPTDPSGTAKAQILTTTVALPSTAIINVASGGTLYIANPGVIIPCPVNIYGLGNAEAYGALRIESGALISGVVTLYGNTTMGNAQSGTSKLATISGNIVQSGGTYGITFTAEPGTIVLSGTNTYSGYTTISGGVLAIGGAGQLGSGNYAAPITNNATFYYNSSLAQTFSGVISGTGALDQAGPGSLTLTGVCTFTGPISNAAQLTITGAGQLGGGSYAGLITNNGTLTYNSSAVQSLTGTISGTGSLTESGSGTLTLAGVDTYTGATTISAGSLALASGGSVNNTASVNIAAGATLDLSAYTLSYTFSTSTSLTASGTGTNSGTNAATIKGGSGGTVSLASQPINLNFAPGSLSGDTNHPALYVSQGNLTLGTNVITVTNQGGGPLGAGTYSLIQVPGGNINASAPTVTVTGSGLSAGATASLSVSNNSVNLVVTASAIPAPPAITGVAYSGGSVVIKGTNGPDSGTYYVKTSTNLAVPLTNWTYVSTNLFGPTGAFSVTNAVTNSPSFFIIATPK